MTSLKIRIYPPTPFLHTSVEYTAPGHIKAASISSPEAQVLTGPKLINLVNGMISLIDLGLNQCFSGFGEATVWWCEGLESYYSNDDYDFGKLEYSPTNTNVVNIVDELSLLLTAGRLGSASKDIIVEAFRGESTTSDGVRLAQKLIATTPEFHSTSVFDKSSTDRPEVEASTASNRLYKAVSLESDNCAFLSHYNSIFNNPLLLCLHLGCFYDVGWGQ